MNENFNSEIRNVYNMQLLVIFFFFFFVYTLLFILLLLLFHINIYILNNIYY